MELKEVASGVHHATANRVNWLLISDGDSVTIVDSGWPKDYDMIIDSLQRIGSNPAQVAGVLLTHGHTDHLGCAEQLRTEHDIPAFTHEIEAPLARGEIHQAIATS